MTRLFAGTQFDRPPRCERCEELESDCRCEPLPPAAPERIPAHKQTARISVEKRKRGKMVTVVRGLDPVGTDLPSLLTLLKTKCGAGGTIQDDQVEIQGRQVDQIQIALQELGFRVKG